MNIQRTAEMMEMTGRDLASADTRRKEANLLLRIVNMTVSDYYAGEYRNDTNGSMSLRSNAVLYHLATQTQSFFHLCSPPHMSPSPHALAEDHLHPWPQVSTKYNRREIGVT